VTALLVAVGGAGGALVRWGVDRAISARFTPAFPWGTFLVNVVASGLAGLLAGAGVRLADGGAWVGPLLGTGLAGALSTFSTFSYETMRLVEDGSWVAAVANVAASVAAGLAAAGMGGWLGQHW
jgi:CrcB protein